MKKNKAKYSIYEYIKYWVVTIFVLILTIPVIVIKAIGFLIKSAGAPLKSIKYFVGFILIVILAVAALLWFKIYVPYSIGDEIKSVKVETNDSFSKVISDLKKKEIIKDDYLFRQLSIITGVDRDLTPGRYDFSGHVSLKEVLQKFVDKDIATVKITIPEGLTARAIGGYFERAGLIDSSQFSALAYDTQFTQIRYQLQGLEGYLFPETYRCWYGMSVDMIIDMLIGQFNNLTADVISSDNVYGFTKHELITLASIIEAEALYTDEMPTISSVYHNRLRRSMLLQADPTVIYALGGLDRELWYRDLEIDSPYNTYKYKGLPPGPINNPGLHAIKAALNPEGTDYLYFVADGEGRHVFSRTLKEHNRAKSAYKKKLREQSNN